MSISVPYIVENPYNKNKLQMDIDSMKGIIEKRIERGELTDDTPVDVIYGEMLCWNMSGDAYSFEARTKEFCRLFLLAIIRHYISEK